MTAPIPGWLTQEVAEARTRRFIRAQQSAKEDLAALPEHRREELSRAFDEATESARRHATYRRGTRDEIPPQQPRTRGGRY